MAIPESGFINNVNLVASKLSTIEEAAILFDTATVEILNQIASLDIEAIVEDLKKSNYLGNRKLDINLALNNLSTSTQVAYSQANLVLKNGTTVAVPFQVQLPNSTWVTEELTSHADIKNYIQNSSQFINSVINTELTVEDELGLSPQLIRFRDADGTSSNLDRVELIAYSGSYIDGTVQYTWIDTTSSLQTLANRATDILVLGQSIDAIVVLSNMPTQIDSLHTNMAKLTALYTDLTEIMTVYSNLQAVLAVANSIGSVNTVSINIADILSVNTNIVPNLAEILQADSNAVAAALSQTQAAGSAANASISASNAATSASTALGYLNQFSTLVAQANTLVAGSNASASYNSSTGVLTLGIPQGIKGDKGDAFSVSAFGTFATRSTYDAQALGFSFLAVDTSTLYFKASNTSGDWSAGVLFGKGDKGDTGVQGYSWLTGSGVPFGGLGVNGDLYLNQANADVYNKVGGSWGTPITNLAAGINDATTSSALTWSSTKVSTELGLKSNTTHTHAGVYEPANANLQSHLTTTTNPHAVTKAQVGLGNVDNTSNATERTATATLTNKTVVVANNTITTATSGNLTATELNGALAELQTDIDTRVATSSKDASGGVVGMTLFKINFKNLANTFTSQFVNSNTASRDYTFQDRSGTIADNTDLALKANIASPTFTGTVTLPTDTVAITKAAGSNTTAVATTAHVFAERTNAATLTNKTIVVANNTITTAVSGNLTSTNLNAALAELQADIDELGASNYLPITGGSLTGLLNQATGTDIASTSTVDLTSATGNTVRITGTTAITAFTMNAGQQMELIAVGALPLTYNATTMNINGGVSYTCTAGDRLSVTKDGAGVVRVNVTKQDGTAVVAPPAVTFASQSDYNTGTNTTKALNSSILRANNLVAGTAITTTSGTSHDFTGIPSWVKRITLMFNGVSTNGSSVLLVQLGDSGGIENTGYLSTGSIVAISVASTAYTTGFGLSSSNVATYVFNGAVTISLIDGFSWVESATLSLSTGVTATSLSGGSKTLSAALDRIRITTVNGTDAFDAGSINIIYE